MKSDTQLQRDVLAELAWEPSINAAHIGVEVQGGVVTLAGHVDSYAEKWDAERAAQGVSGVKALAVEMDVNLPALGARTDADVARTVENVLQWMTYWPRDAVKVLVEDGWVTLSGKVNWNYQRLAAASGVRHLMGVKGVSDQITVEHAVVSDSVKSDIEAALRRHANSGISVAVDNGAVTLTGTVRSWGAFDLASHAAWGTPGVHSVANKVTIDY
jgi:osmotically-inducible protein OsmY